MATNKQKVNSSNSQNLHKIDGKFTLYNTNRQVPTVYFSSLKSLNRKLNLNNLIGLKSTIINISYTFLAHSLVFTVEIFQAATTRSLKIYIKIIVMMIKKFV